MNKDIKELVREDILSDFIDDLNNERKPRVHDDMELHGDEDLLELFETVRAVKRFTEIRKFGIEAVYTKEGH